VEWAYAHVASEVVGEGEYTATAVEKRADPHRISWAVPDPGA
jgi:hypothetical protein